MSLEAEMLRDYILQYCREDAESTIKAADDAVNKIFAFNQKWDLERSETPIVFADKIDFLHQLVGFVFDLYFYFYFYLVGFLQQKPGFLFQ